MWYNFTWVGSCCSLISRMRGFKEKSFREKETQHFLNTSLGLSWTLPVSTQPLNMVGGKALVISILQMANLKVRLGEPAQGYLAPAEQTGGASATSPCFSGPFWLQHTLLCPGMATTTDWALTSSPGFLVTRENTVFTRGTWGPQFQRRRLWLLF